MNSTEISINKPIQVYPLKELYRSIDITRPDNQMLFERICIIVVTEGTLQHEIDNVNHQLTAGSVALLLPEQSQNFLINENVQGYFITYKKESLCQTSYTNLLKIYTLFDRCIKCPVFISNSSQTKVLKKMSSSLGNIIVCNELDSDNEIAKNQLLTLLLTIGKLPTSNSHQNLENKNSDYTTFKGLIYEHLTTCKSTKEYADMMNRTPKALNHICRSAIGVTAKDLINERLLFEIRKQLILKDKSVEEVAVSLGFQTTSYLTRYFKQHSGVTPLSFKKSRST